MILKHKEISDKILKAFFNVYNSLGRGFLESVYEKSMIIELNNLGLKAESQMSIDVYYQNEIVGEFRAGIVVENRIIIELKAVKSIIKEHEAQLMKYLKATKIEVGLLLNFGEKPEIKRFAYDNSRKINIPKIIEDNRT